MHANESNSMTNQRNTAEPSDNSDTSLRLAPGLQSFDQASHMKSSTVLDTIACVLQAQASKDNMKTQADPMSTLQEPRSGYSVLSELLTELGMPHVKYLLNSADDQVSILVQNKHTQPRGNITETTCASHSCLTAPPPILSSEQHLHSSYESKPDFRLWSSTDFKVQATEPLCHSMSLNPLFELILDGSTPGQSPVL